LRKHLKQNKIEDPNHCPFCGSDNISGGPIDGYDICATRNIKCNDCEAEWTEQFELLEINNAFRDK